MIRVAFTLIDGKNWTGGYNYLLNLLRVLTEYQKDKITPVLFFGTDATQESIAPFSDLPSAEIVLSPHLNVSRRSRSLMAGLIIGADPPIRQLFKEHRIDTVFETAHFFGWHLGLPIITWIPDFQHKILPHLFTRRGWWKRELGFRSQIISGRTIMLSSADAQADCERFYPSTQGRTHVVRFAIPHSPKINTTHPRTIADNYGLPEQFFFIPNQFWQHKNHLLVIEALALLNRQGHRVVIAASGLQHDPRNFGHFSKILNAIEHHHLKNQFYLLGMIPYEHLALLMQASIALINPSLFEGWSTTVEEARALGIPMILSDLAVHHEQAGNDATYFRRDNTESLAEALWQFEPLTTEQRIKRTQNASMDAELRVRCFAKSFADLAQHSATN